MKSEEIARLANVSRSTVSRVINNYSNVPEETRQRVMKVIEEYNYIPNYSARNLAGKSNNIITLFIYDEEREGNYTHRWKGSNSPYFMKMIAELIDAAKKRQYIISVYVVTDQAEYDFAVSLFRSRAISGGIFAGFESQKAQLEKLMKQGFRMVIVDPPEGLEETEKAFCVYSDDEGGAYDAVRYLLENGYRCIGHITGDERMSSQKRLCGYRRAMKEAGIDVLPGWIEPGLYQEEAAYQAARHLIEKEKVEAIFVANDAMAIAVFRALMDMGKSVPEDVAVVGFDHSEILPYMGVELTTVEISLKGLAETVMKLICEEPGDKIRICPARLVEKKTVRKMG